MVVDWCIYGYTFSKIYRWALSDDYLKFIIRTYWSFRFLFVRSSIIGKLLDRIFFWIILDFKTTQNFEQVKELWDGPITSLLTAAFESLLRWEDACVELALIRLAGLLSSGVFDAKPLEACAFGKHASPKLLAYARITWVYSYFLLALNLFLF